MKQINLEHLEKYSTGQLEELWRVITRELKRRKEMRCISSVIRAEMLRWTIFEPTVIKKQEECEEISCKEVLQIMENCTRAREVLEEFIMWYGYKGYENGKYVVASYGLPLLKKAFEVLGWEDPHTLYVLVSNEKRE